VPVVIDRPYRFAIANAIDKFSGPDDSTGRGIALPRRPHCFSNKIIGNCVEIDIPIMGALEAHMDTKSPAKAGGSTSILDVLRTADDHCAHGCLIDRAFISSVRIGFDTLVTFP
jgi:hypothetical protein